MEKEELETKVWYRLIKVLYGIGWILVLLVTFVAFYITKPNGQVEMSKSGFTCPNKKSYVWSNYVGSYTKTDRYLNESDNMSALTTCGLFNTAYLFGKSDLQSFKNQALAAGYSTIETEYYINSKMTGAANKLRMNPRYELRWVTDETPHKWQTAVVWTLAVFVICGLLLDTARNALVYIISGKWLSYWWLKR